MTTAGVLSAGLRGLGVCFLVAGCKDLARWAVDALGAHSASTSERVARYHLDSELMRACSLFVVGMLLLVGARRVASWILAGRDTTLSLGSLRVAALGGVSAGFLLGALGDVLVKGLLSGPPAGSWESGNSHWSASAGCGRAGVGGRMGVRTAEPRVGCRRLGASEPTISRARLRGWRWPLDGRLGHGLPPMVMGAGLATSLALAA